MNAALEQAAANCCTALRLAGFAAGNECLIDQETMYARYVSFSVSKFKRKPIWCAMPVQVLLVHLTKARAAGFKYAMINVDKLPGGAVAVELRTSKRRMPLACPLSNQSLVAAVANRCGWFVKASYYSSHKSSELGADVFHLVPKQ